MKKWYKKTPVPCKNNFQMIQYACLGLDISSEYDY